MSKWIRHRGSKGMPKRLEGKRFEVRFRDGAVLEMDSSVNQDEDAWAHRGWKNDTTGIDVMAYRILGNITPPDYSKCFPVGTTAKDIGAKVGDRFVAVSSSHFSAGEIVTMDWDDGTMSPRFTNGLKSRYENFAYLAPIQPKTAIELQAEEVGIPEPVRLVDDDVHLGIKRPDGDGWVKYNAGDVIDLDGVVSIDLADKIGHNMTCPAPEELRWADNETDQIAWYRLNYGDASQHYASEQQAAEADKRIDEAAQVVREAFSCKSERVENDDEIAHDPDVDEPIGKRVADAMFAEIMKRPPSEHLEDDLQAAASRIKWESVFGLRDIVDAARNVGVEIKFESPAPTTAPDFLQSALNTLTQRGKDYDKPEGERSAAAVAVAFNAITGKDLTDAEVYLVLQLVKDVRQWQCADYHADSALDCVAYAALKAEALAASSK